jgi:hypothetical protein
MKSNSTVNPILKNEVEKNKLKKDTKNDPSQPELTVKPMIRVMRSG